MEKAVEQELVKSISVSNFNKGTVGPPVKSFNSIFVCSRSNYSKFLGQAKDIN